MDHDAAAARKTAQTTALTRVTKIRNTLTRLMCSRRNETEFNVTYQRLLDLVQLYETAHNALLDAIDVDEEATRREDGRFRDHMQDIAAFCQTCEQWVSDGAETSTTASATTKSSSSHVSARAREKARIAELKAERAMLTRQQALEAERRAFDLDLKIEKALARERAYDDELNLSQHLDLIDEQHCAYPWGAHAGPSREPSAAPDALHAAVATAADAVPVAASTRQPSLVRKDFNQPFFDPMESLDFNFNFDPTIVNSNFDFKPPVFGNSLDQPDRLHATAEPQFNTPHSTANPQISTPQQFTAPIGYNRPTSHSIQNQMVPPSLPKLDIEPFCGKISQYKVFTNAFDSRIANRLSSQQDKLHYLNQFLKGEPRELIESCFHIQSNPYDEARKILDRAYGNPYKLSMHYVNELNEWPVIKPDDPIGLRKFAAFIERCLCAMRGTEHVYLLDHPTTLLSTVGKLPKYLQGKWRERAHQISLTRTVHFSDISEFVHSMSEVANDPLFGRTKFNEPKVSDARANNQKSNSLKQSNFSTYVGSASKKCIFCHANGTSNHDTDDCFKFNALSIKEKRDFLGKGPKMLCVLRHRSHV